MSQPGPSSAASNQPAYIESREDIHNRTQLIRYLRSWTVANRAGYTDNDIAQAEGLPNVVDRKMASTIAPYVPVVRVNATLGPTANLQSQINCVANSITKATEAYRDAQRSWVTASTQIHIASNPAEKDFWVQSVDRLTAMMEKYKGHVAHYREEFDLMRAWVRLR